MIDFLNKEFKFNGHLAQQARERLCETQAAASRLQCITDEERRALFETPTTHTKYLTATADLRKQLALHKKRHKNDKN